MRWLSKHVARLGWDSLARGPQAVVSLPPSLNKVSRLGYIQFNWALRGRGRVMLLVE